MESCKKEYLTQTTQTPELSLSTGEYGPETCTLPDGVTGAQCAMSDDGGCYESTDCKANREDGAYISVYNSLLNSGEITPLEVGDKIEHPDLIEALRIDGFPISQ